MENVKLRPLTMDDAPVMAELANNEKISINLRDGFPHPYTLKHAEEFISHFKEHHRMKVFGIEYNSRYAGNISLNPGENIYRKSAEIGYFLGEPYWNKGIMTEAVMQMVIYGFKYLDIVRIHTGIFEYNKASQRVLEKCGFKKEAVFEKAIFKNNQLWDEVRYALLIPEHVS
jgi:[ribosomal protein S5]-alanine N-acetyltransferase